MNSLYNHLAGKLPVCLFLSFFLAAQSLSALNYYWVGGPGDWTASASLTALILVALASALPVLLPVPRFPRPAGTYQVGTTIQEFVDESRQEIYSGRDEPALINNLSFLVLEIAPI